MRKVVISAVAVGLGLAVGVAPASADNEPQGNGEQGTQATTVTPEPSEASTFDKNVATKNGS